MFRAHARAGGSASMAITLATRSGRVAAMAYATAPPKELPTRCTWAVDHQRVQQPVEVVDEVLHPVAGRRPGGLAVPAQVVHDDVQALLGEPRREAEVVAGEAVDERAGG